MDKRIYLILAVILLVIVSIQFIGIQPKQVGSQGECIGGTCMQQYYEECKGFEKEYRFHENIDLTVKATINGKDDDYCVIEQVVMEDNTPLDLEGKKMVCNFPIGGKENVIEHCTGDLIDALGGQQ
ncbi:MAG: hypothetical protein ACQESG_05270 [Nanobdellota archaeon]